MAKSKVYFTDIRKDVPDHLTAVSPNANWKLPLEHGEKTGPGSRGYELITL